MLDRYVFGEVERISPEAPVPVLKVAREEERPGAAANVARNVKAMGAECQTLFSPDYERGKKVVKTRLVCKNQQMLRVDLDEPQAPVNAAGFQKRMQESRIIVFSDYGKGSLQEIASLIHQAKVCAKQVLVDPKGFDWTRYRGADVIKPNIYEMKELVGGWHTETQLSEKAHNLLVESGIGAILLTRADKGMTLYEKDEETSIPAHAREVFDVSGAGDTAIAALACALHRGHPLADAARYANRAAGIVVQKFGTCIATEVEVFG